MGLLAEFYIYTVKMKSLSLKHSFLLFRATLIHNPETRLVPLRFIVLETELQNLEIYSKKLWLMEDCLFSETGQTDVFSPQV